MKRKHLGTYVVLPLRRFSSNVGGGERIDCDGNSGLDTDVAEIVAAGTITAECDASRSSTRGKFILLSTIICGLLTLPHTLITYFVSVFLY